MCFDYWRECILSAIDDCEPKIILTDEQREYLIDVVRGAAQNEHMAYAPVESPYPDEIKKLKQQLDEEREKVFCDQCRGRGRITSAYGTFTSTSQCWKCNGEGRHKP